MEDKKIFIIGAGLAGLTAAVELEKMGYAPTVLEATDRAGGRVKTDYANGFQFDHGFQVLLTEYPEVKRYLDLEALSLGYFKPGATIYRSGKIFQLVDPWRQPAGLFTAILSPVGSIFDKLKIWQLSTGLKRLSIDEIFKTPSVTTLEYLQNYGFSDRIIDNFFRPFFSGIFLENELSTSSRLFQFIFKMFAEGHAAVPAQGMQAIPEQLAQHLEKTTFHFNTAVEQVSNGQIKTSKGDFAYDAVIIGVEPSSLLADYKKPSVSFKSTVNLYFNIPKQNSRGFIGLIADKGQLSNNIAMLDDVGANYNAGAGSLISVSIVGKPTLNEDEIVAAVSSELAGYLNIAEEEIKHLKSYFIDVALPVVNEPVMNVDIDKIRHTKGIYLAGDYLLGGSLNGAMLAGRQSAESLHQDQLS